MGVTIFRPGQRLVIPGVQVFQTRVTSAAAATWWDNNGAISGCVAAYQPKGAADLAASYVNLANPGTYDAAPGVAPTLDASGWVFNGSTQYLTTGITPTNDQTWSWIVRFSDGPTNLQQQLFGSSNAGPAGPYFGYMPFWAGGFGYFLNGSYLSLTGNTSGVCAVAGNKAYIAGVSQSGTIPAEAGTIQSLYVGCRNQGGATAFFINAKIQALAIYSTTLTAGQVATITTAMQAL